MRGLWILCFAALTATLRADITVTLSNDFIDSYRRRTTISGQFIVSAAHAHPNAVDPAGKEDGDMHIAGDCDTVGLPMVAEIMNAKRFLPCVDFVHQREASHDPTPITGVWRLWFEHPGPDDQTQFGENTLGPYPTNPYHVFEIHPVTQFGTFSLLESFAPIQDGNKEFGYKSASAAFGQWLGKACTITPGDDMTSIKTSLVQFNYVKFRVAKLPDSTFEVEDGTFMYASIYDPKSSKRYVRKARLVLVNGTSAQAALRDTPVGKKVTVIGMPRLSLSLVAWRRDSSNPTVRKWKLPFEMVILAVKG